MPRTISMDSVRRGVAIPLLLALAGAILVIAARPVAAADQLEFTNFLHGDRVELDLSHPVYGSVTGEPVGAMVGDLNGSSVVFYCIDAARTIVVGDVVEEGTWASTGATNVATAAAILSSYDALDPSGDPAGYALTGTAQVRAASIQAAIWYYSNDVTTTGPAEVVANIATIVAAVDADALTTVMPAAPTVSITGSPASGPAGTAVGPFEVVTNAPSAELSTTGGEIVDWTSGLPLSNPVAAGTQFGVRSTTPGDVSITATVDTVLGPNRVFVSTDLQPVMLADNPAVSVGAAAAATFAPPPPGPPAPTTSTTAPGGVAPTSTSTTSTTAAPATTSTSAAGGALSGRASAQVVQAQAVPTQTLPNTGSSTGFMVAMAMVFLTIGLGVYSAGRRGSTAPAES